MQVPKRSETVPVSELHECRFEFAAIGELDVQRQRLCLQLFDFGAETAEVELETSHAATTDEFDTRGFQSNGGGKKQTHGADDAGSRWKHSDTSTP